MTDIAPVPVVSCCRIRAGTLAYENMANGQRSCVLVLALTVAVAIVFENFPLGAEGRKMVDLRQEEIIVDNSDAHEEIGDPGTHVKAGRQKRGEE